MRSPIKYPGGKSYLAPRIIELAQRAPHTHYVETHGGSAATLFEKDFDGISEVINDIDGDLTTFWRVLQSEDKFERFRRMCVTTPFSVSEFDRAYAGLGAAYGYDEIWRAWAYFVRCRQSRCGQGEDFAALSRNRTRRGMNEQASAWLSAVDGLPEVCNRLRRVVILDDDAVRVIRQQDGANTLFYVDPPYLHSVRKVNDLYRHEMTVQDHIDLLGALLLVKGKVIISGYPNELYDLKLVGWNVLDIVIDNKMSAKKKKRQMTERLWSNF